MFSSLTPPARGVRSLLFLESLEDRTNPAPPLQQTIPGITFDEDQANQTSGNFHIPPDPYGAAGPAHVVSIVNTSIEFHRISDGAQQLSQSLKGFFASVVPAPVNDLFDPKVVYDQFENRFVVVALERVLTGTTSSRILLAASDDADPNGTWRFVAINSKLNIGGIDSWADYPGIAVDEEAVYVTNNMFPFAGGSATGVRLWVLPKGVSGGWYSGAAVTPPPAINPYVGGAPAVTSMPAHIYGTAPGGATGTFLVGYNGISDGTNEFIQITRIDNPLTTPTFNVQQINVGNIDNTGVQIPDAPQSGTATLIDAGDRNVYNAVWRNNRLYFATTVSPGSGTDANQATAHWFHFNTANLSGLALVDQGNVGGEDIAAGTHTYYPQVAVDVDGAMGIGFAASASSIFAGAYYTGRRASDPAGTVQSSGTLKTGEAFYIRTFNGTRNRWGDYSGLSIAPDGRSFWLFNEYAMTRGTVDGNGHDGRWATMWGRFAFNSPPQVTTPIADVTVNEDAGPTTIDLNPHFADAEDPDSALVYTVVGNTNAALVSTTFPAANTLRLTYAANVNGTATLTVRATDTGGASVEDTFLVTVTAVNDAPVLDNTGTMALADVPEDASPNPGTLITDLIASAGGDRITDADSGALEGIAVTATNTTNGVWEFSTNNGAAWSPLGTVSTTSARLLAADTQTRVRFVPDANFFGTFSTALTFRAWDRTTGTNGGTADPGAGGAATAFSTEIETAALAVTSVNDPPSFTRGPDQTVPEDAAAQSVAAWAAGMSPGPANESGQTLTFLVTTNNDALFSVLPAVSPSGTLTYTPAANAFGAATVTVRLRDSGGTANGGADISPPQTFTITLTAVNDAPSFTKGANQAVNEDAAAQSVTSWATAISKGPANESGQVLTFDVSTNNDALFSALPAVDPATGTLTYTPAANAFGAATVTVRLRDDGGTANGGVDASPPQSFTITVNSVNDAPSFTTGADQIVNEDAGGQSIAEWATALSKGPANESGQALSFEVTNNTNAGLFATAPAVSPVGTLTFTPAANAFGSATITLRVRDDGGIANGGVDASATQTFTITVNPVNDAPAFTKGGNQAVNEDAGGQSVANWATAISPGPADESGQTLTFDVTTSNDGLFSALPAVAANGTLTYTPAANANGSATVTVRLRDSGGTANGGIDTSTPQTFTVTVSSVNDAPSFTAGPNVTVNEDAGAQGVAEWATNLSRGPADEGGQALTFEVTNNTNAGLFSTAPAVTPAGTLTFTPAANASGSATITLRLRDSGGTANGGADVSPTQSFTITVNSVNDAPSFNKGADQTVSEDAGAQTAAGWATAISAGPASEGGQVLTFEVTTDNNALFSALPAVGPTGTLTYTPAANAFGVATVTVRLKDDGGTANGGIDTSPPQTFNITVNSVNDAPTFTRGADQAVNEDAGPQAVNAWATGLSAGPANESNQSLTFEVTNNSNPGLFSAGPTVTPVGALAYTPAANAFGTATITLRLKDDGGTANGGADASATQTFTITVNAVNDPPSFTKGGDQSATEDAGAQSVASWATAISPGANEAGQTLTFEVTTNNDALFAVVPAVSPAGTLTYTPAANAFGLAAVTVRLRDNGGTANGGIDVSPPQTFTIAVAGVNDAPAFTRGGDQAVNEDAGPQAVASWATGISPGPANESAQALSFEVTNNSNPGLFATAPAVSPTGTLTYTPAADGFGTATITLRVRDDGGTANGGIDASATQTFMISVNGVNDAPGFTGGGNQAVTEDAGAVTVANWATAISAGPANESGQTLTFDVLSNTNPGLFAAAPAVSSAGTLTFTPAPDAFGSATVTVRLRDSGGTTNGGVDTSPPQTFTITVSSVNDAPSFTRGANQTVLEDAGPQAVASWATAVSPGPAGESGQAVAFEVTANSNPGLFAVAPAVSPSGTLTFTPAADVNGSATITLRLKDDGGGADTSAAQTFTISVTPVNDAPGFTKGADQSVGEDAGPQTVPAWATAVSKGAADEGGQTVTFEVTGNSNPALFSAPPAVSPAGVLTYTPAANAFGSATVTLRLRDDGGTLNGGIDVSAPQTFTITVNPVNDAPSFTRGPSQAVPEDAGPQTVAGWATGISAGSPDEAGQALTFEVVGNTNPGLFATAPAVSPSGALTYTPAADAVGSATVQVRLRDDGGTANGGVDTSAAQTFSITINGVNDAPAFIAGGDQAVLEDAGAQSVPGWATAISAGPADEGGQALTFLVTTSNPSLFAAQPAISPTGTLTYTPAANASGSAAVTVRLRDSGGTLNGGVNTSVAQSFTINVSPVNDAPSFTKGANQTVNEDAGPRAVAAWATGVSAGPADERGQVLTFEVTGNTNPGLFAVGPAVDPAGMLTYTPAADTFGSATITVRLRDDGGTADGGQDASPDQTFTITVNPVNDAPTFTRGADPTVNEDAGPQTVPGWATAVSAGPADEAGQSLTFEIVSNSNPALFAGLPVVSPDGTLTYAPAADAFGTATVQVRLRDDGGTANGGQNTSLVQSFTLTVNPVNDAPSFTAGGDITASEDAGPVSRAEWASDLRKGPANESGQALAFEVTANSNPGLFAVAPAVTPAGTLRFTPAANAHGSATIQVRLIDDGGTANGGADVSPPQTFTITVNALNDRPVAVADAAPTTDQQLITVDVLANDTDADGDALTLVSVTGATKGTATIDTATNQIRYTPRANAHGADVLTYTARDPSGATATGTLTVQVTDVTRPAVREVRLYYSPTRYELLTDRIPVLGWSNVRRVQVLFTERVSVQQNDLSVTGPGGPGPGGTYTFSAFAYNANTFTATWTLSAPIGIDRVRLSLDGTTAGGVSDTSASDPEDWNRLGADVVRLFAVLPGDLDGDGLVTKAEADTVKRNIGKRYPTPKTADVNGDGLVTLADYRIALGNVGKRI